MRVFAQRAEPTIDLPELFRATRSYFDATIEILSQVMATNGAGDRVEVELRSAHYGYSGRFFVSARRTSEHDLADARLAEEHGRAAGMAALAQRCATVWDVEPSAEDSELARLNLCGILASVALGPVLPDDVSTLYGVRGAMERVAHLLKDR